MNALYVTVSIPLLLVLAGFNHAHGLTTFGKPNNQGTQQTQKTTAKPKYCTSQVNCSITKDTTCIKDRCLCGNNENPDNGKCSALKKGQFHLCERDSDCVDHATCVSASQAGNKSKALVDATAKICLCEDGLREIEMGKCGGESNFMVLPGLVMIVTALSRTLY